MWEISHYLKDSIKRWVDECEAAIVCWFQCVHSTHNCILKKIHNLAKCFPNQLWPALSNQ